MNNKMKGNLTLFFIMAIFFSISLVSAFNFDNVKQFSKNATDPLGTIKIVNSFGLGATLAEYTLESNTNKCLYYCSAEGVTILNEDGSLFSDVNFKNEFGNSASIKASNFYYSTSTESYDEQVFDNQQSCLPTGKGNETICTTNKVLTGTVTRTRQIWLPYHNGDVLPAGKYHWKIDGFKQPEQTIDWVASSRGIQMTDWAFWIGVTPSAYYKFNENSGNASDSSGNNMTMTLNLTGVGFINYTAGKLGNAITITRNATPIFYRLQSNSTFQFNNSNFTIAGWFNASTCGAGGTFFDNGQTSATGWGLVCNGTTIQFINNNANILNTVGNIVNSTWNRFVITREGTGANAGHIYVNGRNQANGTISATLSIAGTASFYWSGSTGNISIDDFQVFNNYAWNVGDVLQDYLNGTGKEGNTPSIGVVLNAPVNNTNTTFSNLVNFIGVATPDSATITSATFYTWDSNNNLVGQFTNSSFSPSNSPITISYNIFPDLPNGYYKWNILVNGNNLSGSAINSSFATSNFTFFISGSNITSTRFNSSTYETSYEGFTSNITSFFPSISSVKLSYNNVIYNATVTPVGNNFILNKNMDIPSTGANNNSWFWQLIYSDGSQENLTTNYQSVGLTDFELCNSTLNTVYNNFTFKNETSSLENVSASISSTWTYWLGSGTVNKTLSYSNAGELKSYGFCLNPASASLNGQLSFDYYNGESPQRRYSLSSFSLTNTTTNQILYLLPSSQGIYSSYSVVESIGSSPITGAQIIVERLIGSSYVTITSTYTDSTGLATFWLNPNFAYRFTVSKSGYSSNQFSINPSQSLYTVTLTATGSGTGSYNTSLQGYKWYVVPSSGTLTPGIKQFNLTLTNTLSNLYGCQFSLVNISNGAVINTTSGSLSSSACNLSLTYNLSNGHNIFGKVYINNTITNGQYLLIDGDYKWITIDKRIVGNGSLIGFFQDLKKLPEFGGDANRREFSRIMFFFLVSTVMLAAFTYITGFEIQNPGVALLLLWFLIAIASYAGFLTFESGSDNINAAIEKYGILVIYSLFAFGYVINQLRRNS